MESRRPLVYIAGPYSGASPVEIAWNIARAGLIARLAVLHGLAPVLVHPSIPLIYGEDTPPNRELGLECDASIVAMIGRSTLGKLWILENDAGMLTPGVRVELVAWAQARGSSTNGVVRGTWEIWTGIGRDAGIGREFAALAERPTAMEGLSGMELIRDFERRRAGALDVPR